jgi:fucose permease
VRHPVHYAWKVAAVIFVVLLAAAGVCATPSVLIVPLEQEFGWNRALISSAVSVNLILYGLVGPFAAAVMQSAGIRRTVIASLALTATGVALTTAMRTP